MTKKKKTKNENQAWSVDCYWSALKDTGKTIKEYRELNKKWQKHISIFEKRKQLLDKLHKLKVEDIDLVIQTYQEYISYNEAKIKLLSAESKG
jgi:hypothetical protein